MLGNLLKRLLHRSAARPAASAPQASHGAREAGDNWPSKAMRLRQLGRQLEIVALCRSVLARQPDNADALNFLAAALLAQGELHEGIACLRRLTDLAPDSAQARVTLAAVLAATGNANGAIENYRRAVRLRPDLADAWSNLAALLKALGRYDEAEDCCRSGLRSNTQHAAMHHTLAGALFEQGRVDEAIAEVRAALALNPDAPAAHSDLLRMLNYADGQDPVAVFQEHRSWAVCHARALEEAALPLNNDPDPARPLRVGYVSPYFRKHAVTFFLESVIQHHDRKNYEVVLYADVAQPDDYSERLQAYGALWRKTVGMDDEQLAQMVRNDAIDILVDLSGHTPNNRLLAFARRPAPVQVTWNGYPNTTGMAGMNYRLTDAHCDPPGATDHLHTESLVRLPRIYMAWQPPVDAPEIGPLPALASGRITFGSFNSCYKITPGLVALWSRILARVRESRLMLLTIGAGAAEHRIRTMFAEHGIDAQRLDIRPRVTHEDFLAAHCHADIALDAFPYHGTTTTCFSLWMGLPVVTLAGAVHASRVGVSMLCNLGLPQLVAGTADEYVEIASHLAADSNALAALRGGLRDRVLRSPLTDGSGCTRALEGAFRKMWTTWCRGQVTTPRDAPQSPPIALASPRNVVVRSDYGPIIVSRNDTMIGKWISREGSWEKDEIELLHWVVSACYGTDPEIEILDVGANIGAHTIAFARFLFPKVVVHAFEAQLEIFDMLTGTVELNQLDNVRCHHRAVSSASGQYIRIPAVDYDQPANFGALELEPAVTPDFDGKRIAGTVETIETVSIDELALTRVRLIKIDAEGMEHKVLAGAAATIERCRPILFLEHEKTDFGFVKSFLRNAGYRCYFAQRPNILCVPAEFKDIRFEGAVSVEY